jgi:hypothetical protein
VQQEFMEEREEVGGGEILHYESAGLVDYSHAKDQVREWVEHQPSKRCSSEAGVWMCIPDGEYMFGRVGFDDTHTTARSFLFFTANTDFTRTALAGRQQTLRKEETHEEKFQRWLREGRDFSGLDSLRQMSAPVDNAQVSTISAPPPPESELLGPYNQMEHVFHARDIEALRPIPGPSLLTKEELADRGIDSDRLLQNRNMAGFVDSWNEPVYDLINEMALSYVERFVLPQRSHNTLSTAAEALFPSYKDSKKLDSHLYSYFVQPHAKPILRFDTASVERRIKTFLDSRSGDTPGGFDEECIVGICRVVAYLISEALELSSNSATGNNRNVILPSDIRIGVYLDRQLSDVLQYSAVMWNGRM